MNEGYRISPPRRVYEAYVEQLEHARRFEGAYFFALAPGIGDIPRTPGRGKLDGTAEQGYLHCGPNGAGHFFKMLHNGIEYGVLAAYAGGLSVLRSANAGKQQHGIDAETTPLRDPERSIGGTGAPGGGSLISEVTDSPLSGRATLK